MGFQKDFVWATATASYQVEGAWNKDGKGASVWDMFAHSKGKVYDNHNGDIACDHYYRFPEDVELLAQCGIPSYRFSLSWPRILPEGIGRVNRKGIDFYNRLVDALLEKNITPYVTLFHWDYPYELYKRGGWLNAESPNWFAEYTRVVVDALSDRVLHWMTINEPQCFVGLGHANGMHAPGLKLVPNEVLLAGHNALLAHGKAANTIRSHSKSKEPEIGFAFVGVGASAASEKSEDIEAARSKMFGYRELSEDFWFWTMAWWLDPVLFGKYPEEALEYYGEHAPSFTDEEMKTISAPVDYVGINLYNAPTVRAGTNGEPENVANTPGSMMNGFGWHITPNCMYWIPTFLYERYKLPIFITECGFGHDDWVHLDGTIPDTQRIDVMRRYLRELKRAANDGVPIKGYTHWAFMDNFEWAEGYRMRFGLVHVDYQTLKRTPKDSAYYYKKIIETNGENL